MLDPATLYEYAKQYGTPLDFWGRANSYSCPVGKEPGVGWVLLLRKDLDALDKNAFHAFRWVDEKRTLVIPSLMIVRATCMIRALAGDKDAAYLVEVADKRRSFRFSSINKAYNVRVPAPGADTYYSESLNSGVAWSWATMIANIWSFLPTTAGAAPALPSTPAGTPDGFRFHGVTAWDALHVVLDKLNFTTAYDPIADSFSIVELGATQAGLAKSLKFLEDRLLFTADPLGAQAAARANVPENIRVFFRAKTDHYDFSHTLSQENNSDPAREYYSELVATGVTGAEAGSVLPLWDDMFALYNIAGSRTNAAALTTQATARKTQYLQSISDRESYHIAGACSLIKPGSQVSLVRWRDYGDGAGLITEITNHDKDFAGAVAPKYWGYINTRRADRLQVSFRMKQSHLQTITLAAASATTFFFSTPASVYQTWGEQNTTGVYYYDENDGNSIRIDLGGRYVISLAVTTLSLIAANVPSFWVEIDRNGDGDWQQCSIRTYITPNKDSGFIPSVTATGTLVTLADAKDGTKFRVRGQTSTGDARVTEAELVFVRLIDARPATR